MEPLRPYVDKEILSVISSQVFTPKDFVFTLKGTCRLNPSLAQLATKLIPNTGLIITHVSKAVMELKSA
jgi:hypothetical protein